MAMDFNAWNRQVIDEFRANGGKVGGQFEGAPMVILHTHGAKSGLERENPLVPLIQDEHIYVIASKGGAPDNPDWYHNLKANPGVTVEYLTETFPATAVVIEDDTERDRLYAAQVALQPGFGEYAKQTARRIPVIELVRD